MLAPQSVIGILGGGQLGRMLSMAATRLGFKSHIFTPKEDSPALQSASTYTLAPYEDTHALQQFAQACDLVTYEFENIPLISAKWVAEHCPLAPGLNILEITQDRLKEKEFLNQNHLETAEYYAVSTFEDLTKAWQKLQKKNTQSQAILKTRHMGYDGKGQTKIKMLKDCRKAWEYIQEKPAILEDFIHFRREISLVISRNAASQFTVYDMTENIHKNHILHTSQAPSYLDESIQSQLLKAVKACMTKLEYIGVMALELFEDSQGNLIANEIAPRVHNSGHWTEDACVCSQFEQHIRSITGWPQGDSTAFAQAHMVNLIGKDIKNWPDLAAEKSAKLHIYGKKEIREGRKMGHITYLSPLDR